MVRSVRRRFARHSSYPLGPECPRSGDPVGTDAVVNTRHRERMRLVLHWAHILRDEDPARVHTWVVTCSRTELELLMLTALAGIDPDRTEQELFGWVEALRA